MAELISIYPVPLIGSLDPPICKGFFHPVFRRGVLKIGSDLRGDRILRAQKVQHSSRWWFTMDRFIHDKRAELQCTMKAKEQNASATNAASRRCVLKGFVAWGSWGSKIQRGGSTYTTEVTNMTGWKITIFNRKHIDSTSGISIVISVFKGVTPEMPYQNLLIAFPTSFPLPNPTLTCFFSH